MRKSITAEHIADKIDTDERFSRREETPVEVGGSSVLGFFTGHIGQGGGLFVMPLLSVLGIESEVATAASAPGIAGSG